MFKIAGFDLPDKIKKEAPRETPKAGKGKKGANEPAKAAKPSADDLQAMLNSLGRGADLVAPAPLKRTRQDIDSADNGKLVKGVKSVHKAEHEDRKSTRGDDFENKKAKKASAEPKAERRVQPKLKESEAKKDAGAKNKRRHQEATSERPKASKAPPAAPVTTKTLTPLQLKMQQKLTGARFRWINEQLYTSESDKALRLFEESPGIFQEYHDGFRHQVESWPENPVDSLVENFRRRLEKPLNAPGGLPASQSGEIVVADMGSGEAKLALQLAKVRGGPKSRRARFKVHSFDLHKANDRITVADIANVPLPDKSVDVVVYCLSLMGTNTEDFIKEGLRVLRPYGEMWIAEIASRFDQTNGKTDVSRFVARLKKLGLHHRDTDDSNRMFVKFEFTVLPHKQEKPKFIEHEDTSPLLKPCIYKRR